MLMRQQLNGPVMADLYGEADRGKSLAIVTLLPYLGPALGPLVGGLVTQLVSWQWVFWIMSMFDALILCLGLVIIRETYTPVLLQRKANAEGITALEAQSSCAKRNQFATKLLRPLHILTHRPIIWIISLISALSFSAYTLVLSSYAALWITHYEQSELVSSLHYISIALGSTIAGQIGSRFMDRMYFILCARNNSEGIPEYRIPYLLSGILLMPVGLFWYGWSAERKLHWLMVDVGTLVFTLGSFVASQAIMAYQLSEFREFSASANGASRGIPYVLAFVFPIFAPDLYDALGYGWGNTVLGFVGFGVGAPMCGMLWVWGKKMREMGRKV
jgi:MFS family permease